MFITHTTQEDPREKIAETDNWIRVAIFMTGVFFWGGGCVFENGGILIREYMWVIQKYLYGNTGIYVGHTEIYTHFFLFFSGLGN